MKIPCESPASIAIIHDLDLRARQLSNQLINKGASPFSYFWVKMCNGYSFSNNGKCSGFDHNLRNLGYNPRIWSLLVVRRCKVKVLKFSIGFGRAIKSWREKTELNS